MCIRDRNDVVLASINTLAENGKYYDMWLRVLSVNTVTNTITVVCYPDDEVPSKKNYQMCIRDSLQGRDDTEVHNRR